MKATMRDAAPSPEPALSGADKARIMARIAADEPLTAADVALLCPPAGQAAPRRPAGSSPPPASADNLRTMERIAPGDAAPVTPPRWHNRLVLGDNRALLQCLRQGPLREQIEAAGGLTLIYIDPPFNADTDFLLREPVGGRHADSPLLTQAAYRDRWEGGLAAYLEMMHERLRLMHELLSERGSIYVHCDWRVQAHLRLMLDDIFGVERFINEIVWHYYNKYSAATARLPRAHDTILAYAKTGRHVLNPLRLPRDQPRRQLVRENVNGTLKNARDADGKLQYRTVRDKKADDVWDIPQLQPASADWSGYETQKHPALLERIVNLASNPGDLVADFFCGTGTTLVAAQRLGRRWLGADLGAHAIRISRRRLLAMNAAFTIDSISPPGTGRGGADAAARDALRTRLRAEAAPHIAPHAALRDGELLLLVPGRVADLAAIQEALALAERHGFEQVSVVAPGYLPGTLARAREVAAGGAALGLWRAGPDAITEAAEPVVTWPDEAEQPGTLCGYLAWDTPGGETRLAALAPGRELLLVQQGLLWRHARARDGRLASTCLTRNWRDWLDAWSVGRWAPEDAEHAGDWPPPFLGAWHAWRRGRERTLSLDWPAPSALAGAPADVLMTMDIRSTTAWAVRPTARRD